VGAIDVSRPGGSGSATMDGAATTTAEEAELRAALAARASEPRGVPVGAVLVHKRHISRLQRLLQPERLVAVDRVLPELFLLHLPHAAAAALDEPGSAQGPSASALAAFVQETGATYFAGVRLQDPLLQHARRGGPTGSRQRGSKSATGERVAPPLRGDTRATRPHDSDFSQGAFRFAEIFAGIGGFRLGLEALGGQCVVASELDGAARAAYRRHWPPAPPDGSGGGGGGGELVVGDITGVYAAQLPAFDVLTAGFPCQPFSERSATQPGLADERGQLYRELVRLLTSCRPAAFLFENVVGLVTMDGGAKMTSAGAKVTSAASASASAPSRDDSSREFKPGETFRRILSAFESCGYSAAWRVINAKEWLPQSRERVYIVGFRTDLGIEMRWDGVVGSAEGLASCPADVLEPPESSDVQGCALSASQWKALQAQAEAYPRWPGCPDPLGERAVALRCARLHHARLSTDCSHTT
jgi:DNA (cytosine-5)-methyltransferase 1